MTRKTIMESIRLFAGLTALALASTACAPAGSNLSGDAGQAQISEETYGPIVDKSVEDAIAAYGEARVHVRAVPSSSGLSMGAHAERDIPPEIISLLARLPEGSFRVEEGVQNQPEALGVLNREGLAALRFDSRVEFVAEDRYDDILQ